MARNPFEILELSYRQAEMLSNLNPAQRATQISNLRRYWGIMYQDVVRGDAPPEILSEINNALDVLKEPEGFATSYEEFGKLRKERRASGANTSGVSVEQAKYFLRKAEKRNADADRKLATYREYEGENARLRTEIEDYKKNLFRAQAGKDAATARFERAKQANRGRSDYLKRAYHALMESFVNAVAGNIEVPDGAYHLSQMPGSTITMARRGNKRHKKEDYAVLDVGPGLHARRTDRSALSAAASESGILIGGIPYSRDLDETLMTARSGRYPVILAELTPVIGLDTQPVLLVGNKQQDIYIYGKIVNIEHRGKKNE